MMWENKIIKSLCLGLILILVSLSGCLSSEPKTLTIATTTSLFDSGLLDEIAKEYKKDSGVELHFIPKGTGSAILDAKKSAVDGLMVHAPPLEEEFLSTGKGFNRKVFAYNFFVIVGSQDSAQIKGNTPVSAMKKIVEAGREGRAIWVSRDDNSGTNTKEKELWRKAGFEYSEIKNEDWFRSTGSGMGKTLLYTSNIGKDKAVYTLSDIGTFLKYRKKGLVSLEAYVDYGEEMLNVYSMIGVVDKKEKDFLNFEIWMMNKGQKILAEYGKDEFGTPLFNPISTADEDTIKWIAKIGFISDGSKVTECPRKYRKYEDRIKFLELGG